VQEQKTDQLCVPWSWRIEINEIELGFEKCGQNQVSELVLVAQ